MDTFTITCNKCGNSVVVSMGTFWFEYTPETISMGSSYDGELNITCSCGNKVAEE